MGPIYKYDVDISKNYLNEDELKKLNKIVTMYLDYAEMQAENHNAMTMEDWIEKLNEFLQFNGKEMIKMSNEEKSFPKTSINCLTTVFPIPHKKPRKISGNKGFELARFL